MVEVAESNAVYYYHFDGLGSVVALSDMNSVLVERYTYDVFGRPTIRDPNGTEIAASAFANPYLFTGRAYDAETGLYYYRARYYDFATGRFLQPDPTGYADGLNLYSYCGNSPVNFCDPMGLCKGSFTLYEIAAVSAAAAQAMSVFPPIPDGQKKPWEWGNFVWRNTRTGQLYPMTTCTPGSPTSVFTDQAWADAVAEIRALPGNDVYEVVAYCHLHGLEEGTWVVVNNAPAQARPNSLAYADQLYSINNQSESETIFVYSENRQGDMRFYYPGINGLPQEGTNEQPGVPGTLVGNRNDYGP